MALNSEPRARPGEIIISNPDGSRKRRKILQTALQPSRGAFLGSSKITLNSIFYPKVGQQGLLDTADTDEADDFTIYSRSTQIPVGRRLLVYRRICSFLRSETSLLSEGHAVRYPYPEHLVLPRDGRSVTLFEVNKGTVNAYKRDVVTLSEVANPVPDIEDGDNSFDYLAAKYPTNAAEDVILPLYGDSEDDEEDAASLLDEIETENREREEAKNAKKHSSLPSKEISRIIDAQEHKYETDWTEMKLPQRRSIAHRTWKKAQGRHLKALIADANRQLGRLETRLEGLKKAMCDETWSRSEPLVKQCISLEPTVMERCELKWKLRTWALKEAPEKLSAKHPKRTIQVRRTYDSSDGEDITSDDASSVESDRSVTIGQNGAPSRSESNSSAGEESDQSVDSVLGPGKPRYHSENATASDPIDLTLEIASEISLEAEDSTLDDISEWSIDALVAAEDRKRLLLKLLYQKPSKVRQRLFRRMLSLGQMQCQRATSMAFSALKARNLRISGLEHNLAVIDITNLRFYHCWVTLDPGMVDDNISIEEAVLQKVKTAMKVKGETNFHTFFDFFVRVKIIFDDEKEHIRAKHQNAVGLKLRQEARQRRDMFDARAEQFKVNMLVSSQASNGAKDVCINPGKDEDEPEIYVNSLASRHLKAHQIQGLEFIWREMVMAGDDELAQGCLLSHTMGLGKTMQAIVTLCTIAEASSSADPRISSQIPHSLRRLQCLILCPAGLVENWVAEFEKWIPHHNHPVGPIWNMDKCKEAGVGEALHGARMNMINQWHKTGGVLLMGYPIFRGLVQSEHSSNQRSQTAESGNDGTSTEGRKTRAVYYDDEERKLLKRWLLEGPNIIIADEAHTLKNPESGVGAAALAFASTRRLALTGSPLANNLSEYYAMINWVAPGFLGDLQEFRDYYQRPIEAGVHADSSKSQQRQSMKKLHALKDSISDKIHRADITALKNDLKPKTEFVLKLALSPVQTELYKAVVNSITAGTGKDIDSVTTQQLWDWMALLGPLCAHPSVFFKIIEARKTARTAKISKSNKATARSGEWGLSDNPATVGDADNLILSDKLPEQFHRICQEHARGLDLSNPGLSPKASLAMDIVSDSKRSNSRVLIFSHRLQTLDYFEKAIRRYLINVRCARFDGSTPIANRQRMLKDFNEGAFDVMLITTRAGGVGLNITAANRVIILDFQWNPVHEQQAIGRVYRIGQSKPVYVYHLLAAETFELPLHHVSIFKTQLAARVVDQRNPLRSAMKARDFLFAPRHIDQDGLESFAGKDPVLDTVLHGKFGASIRAIDTTETLHREIEEELTPAELHEAQQMIEDEKLRRTDHDEWLKRQHGVYYAQMAHNAPLVRPPQVSQQVRS